MDEKYFGRGEGRPLRVEPLYRAKINLNIPYDLALYLTRNFSEKFGPESFMEETIRKKRLAMKKENGFGIDGPEPVNAADKLYINLEKENLLVYESKYIDPLSEAMDLLVEWFLKLNNDLNKNHELKTLLEGKGLKPHLIKDFQISKKRESAW